MIINARKHELQHFKQKFGYRWREHLIYLLNSYGAFNFFSFWALLKMKSLHIKGPAYSWNPFQKRKKMQRTVQQNRPLKGSELTTVISAQVEIKVLMCFRWNFAVATCNFALAVDHVSWITEFQPNMTFLFHQTNFWFY